VHSIFNPGDKLRRFTLDQTEHVRKGLGRTFELVPIFSRQMRLSEFVQDLGELMTKAAGDSCIFENGGPRPKRKGLVFRALDGSYGFKVISNDWLLYQTQKLRKTRRRARRRPGPFDAV
jgi:hypothetical protein